MASPPAVVKKLAGGGFFDNLFRRSRRRQYSEDGSSRRGRRYTDADYSVGKDSSTHSALFDLELSQRGPARISIEDRMAHAAAIELEAKLQRIAYLARPVAGFEMDLLHQVQAQRGGCSSPDGDVDLPRLAGELLKLGYACSLQYNDPAAAAGGDHVSVSSSSDAACLDKLRHSFIVCTGFTDGRSAHYCLVDPQFKDQFRIGQPSAAYEGAINVLQAEFVGSPLRLQTLAELLCREIAEVYAEQQLPLPPWRRSGAMLSRWFDVAGAGSASRGAGPPPPDPFLLAAAGRLTVNDRGDPAAAPSNGMGMETMARVRSGGWSDLATIKETPSPSHPLASSVDLQGKSSPTPSAGAQSMASSEGPKRRGKMVSLLAKGLNSMPGIRRKDSSGDLRARR